MLPRPVIASDYTLTVRVHYCDLLNWMHADDSISRYVTFVHLDVVCRESTLCRLCVRIDPLITYDGHLHFVCRVLPCFCPNYVRIASAIRDLWIWPETWNIYWYVAVNGNRRILSWMVDCAMPLLDFTKWTALDVSTTVLDETMQNGLWTVRMNGNYDLPYRLTDV